MCVGMVESEVRCRGVEAIESESGIGVLVLREYSIVVGWTTEYTCKVWVGKEGVSSLSVGMGCKMRRK